MRRAGLMIFFICFFLSMGSEAAAHKVSIYGYAESGKIYTESYFADGGRCVECAIQIREIDSGQEILSGVTDNEGRFDFNYDNGSQLELLVDSGGGHMGSFILDIRRASGDTEPMPETREPSMDEDSEKLSSLELEAVIEKKLDPIRRELISVREATERPGITEVLGGVGYIIGLLGLWTYLKNREK